MKNNQSTSYHNYAFKNWGKLGNRPMREIMPKANRALVKEVFGWDGERYARNDANIRMGYVRAERAVWLTSVSANTTAELNFAWRIELTLAEAFRKLDELLLTKTAVPAIDN